MSDNLRDILAYAWNGDKEGLSASLDAEMQARIGTHVDNMTAAVSTSLFTGVEEQEIEDVAPPAEYQELETEGTTEDENV